MQTTNEPPSLADLEGVAPPAPDWFREAVECEFMEKSVDVDGVEIAYQQWGNPQKPGLLLVHGNSAHSHWFDFIAPAFAQDFNVVAMNLSGMGNSGWRDQYSLEQYSAEQLGVMQDTGMLDHPVKPIIAAHSFGGIISLETAHTHGDLLTGLVMMDSTVFPPEKSAERPKPRPSSREPFYPNLPAALARFRLMPPQPCENLYILDYIARHSLKPTTREGYAGWTWKFDPTIWAKIDWDDAKPWESLPNLTCKFACIRGRDSVLFTDEVLRDMNSQIDAPFATIDGAGHHMLLDDPLKTIELLKGFFAAWSES